MRNILKGKARELILIAVIIVISVVITSIVFSSGIGLIFGLYPANKAARMKPIDALHYTD